MSRASRRARSIVLGITLAAVVGAVALTWIAMRGVLAGGASRLAVLGDVPDFVLVASDGTAFGSRDLAGQVYVINFFFTRCPSICPVHMQSTKELVALLDQRDTKGVVVVSVSVDPESDTPAVLRDYGHELGVASPRWRLLTGDRAAIVALAEGGLKVPVGDGPAAGATAMDIAHTGRFVLVDGRARIRGYFERSESSGMEELAEAVRRVADERGSTVTQAAGG